MIRGKVDFNYLFLKFLEFYLYVCCLFMNIMNINFYIFIYIIIIVELLYFFIVILVGK